MKKFILAVGLLSIAGTALAAGKSCDELKSEVDAKIKAKGASTYSLDVVAKGSSTDGKVVGTCDAGKNELVYKRG
ncbi:MAG: DUF1161 domain-containing protein [Pseudomonas sp.]